MPLPTLTQCLLQSLLTDPGAMDRQQSRSRNVSVAPPTKKPEIMHLSWYSVRKCWITRSPKDAFQKKYFADWSEAVLSWGKGFIGHM